MLVLAVGLTMIVLINYISGRGGDPLLGDLDQADTVKFAHRQPTRSECQDSLQLGKQLVKVAE